MPRSSGLKTTEESAGVDFLATVSDGVDDDELDFVSLDGVGRAVSSPNSYSSLSSLLAAPILKFD